MPKPGRPRALDETKRREICALLSAGCGIKEAARYVGCAASTIRREAIRNRQFADELRRASVTSEISPLQAIRNASQKYWRAAAWFLERTNPQRFAKQNVRLLKPEQVNELLEMMITIVKEETRDPDAIGRIVHRLEVVSKAAEREAWAERDPAPRSRRPLPRLQPQRHDGHDEYQTSQSAPGFAGGLRAE